MSKRFAARSVTRYILLGAALGTVGAYSGYAMRQSRALPADPADLAKAFASQTSNRAAKASRLAKLLPSTGDHMATYSLASVGPTADLAPPQPERVTQPALRQTEADSTWPPAPSVEPARTDAQAGPKVEAKPDLKTDVKVAALTPVAPPEAKPKRLPAPPTAPSSLLDDSQIAGLKTRLRLTADQAEYWPAVETALRQVARTQLRPQNLKHVHGKPSIDVNSAEVQQLIYAAMPLLMRLREDQKHEVRKLARIIGLEQVAAQI